MPEIRVEQHGFVRVITIANEAKRNAITHEMAGHLLTAFDNADTAEQVRAIVVTGAGDIAFSSGHDLNSVFEPHDGHRDNPTHSFTRPLELRKPVIAAVNGHCYAAALILAISCDLRVASENAAFGSPGARLGMLPEGGQITRLPQLLPPARALEMMFLGEPMSAVEGHAYGFVNRLVPRGKALEMALELARRIGENSPAVVSAVKRGVIQGMGLGVESAMQYEKTVARALAAGPDAKEGVRAFLEKRPPRFGKPIRPPA